MPRINSLKRNKLLKSKKEIDALFINSKSFSSFPVRLVYSIKEAEPASKAAFSVSKRKFKRAVDRNRIKRLLREAYRLQQNEINTKGLRMMWIFTGKKMPHFDEIYSAVGTIINELNKKNGHS